MEDNCETNWIFDSLAKKTMITRLMTVMNGSVVTNGSTNSSKKGAAKRGRGKDKDKENARPQKRARGRNASTEIASAQPAAKSVTGGMLDSFTEETAVCESTVACGVGMRCKLWLDDFCLHVQIMLSCKYVELVVYQTPI